MCMTVRDFYSQRYREYGVGLNALDWSPEGQRKRFEVLASAGDMHGKRVLDLGCGFGDLYDFLEARFGDIFYTGLDMMEPFIEAARNRHPGLDFQVRDVLKEPILGTYDYVLSSGLHNIEAGSNDSDMESLMMKAWSSARTAAVVNFLSDQADRWDAPCHRYKPATMLSAALKVTKWVVLRHDYLPHDFSLFLYHGPRSQ